MITLPFMLATFSLLVAGLLMQFWAFLKKNKTHKQYMWWFTTGVWFLYIFSGILDTLLFQINK